MANHYPLPKHTLPTLCAHCGRRESPVPWPYRLGLLYVGLVTFSVVGVLVIGSWVEAKAGRYDMRTGFSFNNPAFHSKFAELNPNLVQK